MDQIVECVPNFSEGSDPAVFAAIEAAIRGVDGVKFLGLEPDASYNRVVVTFVGAPDPVVEAAVRVTAVASEKIDMTKQKGGHPRFGALDVCPFVPVQGVSLGDCAAMARSYGQRVGDELKLPVYLYESAATRPERKNLAKVRAGEYEALPEKLKLPENAPDFGPTEFVPRFGAVAAGARFFLVAYNIDLDSEDIDAVNEVAYAVRELGTPVLGPDGQPAVDARGRKKMIPGKLRFTKGIGVEIPEKKMSQVSMNLTNYLITAPHVAFEEVRFEAEKRGIRVTGSEVVGLIPIEPLLMAAEYCLFERGERPEGITQRELVQVAHDYLGLSHFTPFDPATKVIEYAIQ